MRIVSTSVFSIFTSATTKWWVEAETGTESICKCSILFFCLFARNGISTTARTSAQVMACAREKREKNKIIIMSFNKRPQIIDWLWKWDGAQPSDRHQRWTRINEQTLIIITKIIITVNMYFCRFWRYTSGTEPRSHQRLVWTVRQESTSSRIIIYLIVLRAIISLWERDIVCVGQTAHYVVSMCLEILIENHIYGASTERSSRE